jgi:hypothetical protein
MTGIGLGLLALALADLVAGGLAGEPRGPWHAVAGIALATASAAAGAWLLGVAQAPILVILVAAGGVCWLLPRCSSVRVERKSWLALGALAAYLALLLALSGEWTARLPGWFHVWFQGLPFTRSLGDGGDEKLVLVVGILLALTATANGLVRAVLVVAGTPIGRSGERLRGGRFIGIIERFLIFGLAVSGEPAAAALIASAKSILRFPELSRVAHEPSPSDGRRAEGEPGARVTDVDVVTEYFLLGSLVSWLAALAPVALLLG